MQSVRLLLDCICVLGTSRDLKSVCEKTVVGDTVCLVSGMGRPPKDTVHRVSVFLAMAFSRLSKKSPAVNGLAGKLQKYICGFREQAPDVWCTVGAGGQRARSLRRHLEVGLGKESKGGGLYITMQLDGYVAIKKGGKTVFFHLPIETEPYSSCSH